jgi:hypothetical protein
MSKKKYGPNTTFPENWKEIMITAGKEGKPNQYFFKLLKIGHSTHFNLLKRDKEYTEVFNQYLQCHETWWVNQAKTIIEKDGGNKFNTQLFLLMMANKQRKRWSNGNKGK